MRELVHNVRMSNVSNQRDELAAWVPTDHAFGTRLAMVRQGMRWNLTEASRECGIGPNDWARYEQNVRPRDYVETVMAIAGRTGVDANWLMLGEPTAKRQTAPVWAVPNQEDESRANKKAPAANGEGLKLPDLDSNQEPAG